MYNKLYITYHHSNQDLSQINSSPIALFPNRVTHLTNKAYESEALKQIYLNTF